MRDSNPKSKVVSTARDPARSGRWYRIDAAAYMNEYKSKLIKFLTNSSPWCHSGTRSTEGDKTQCLSRAVTGAIAYTPSSQRPSRWSWRWATAAGRSVGQKTPRYLNDASAPSSTDAPHDDPYDEFARTAAGSADTPHRLLLTPRPSCAGSVKCHLPNGSQNVRWTVEPPRESPLVKS
ncbi:unnamed protein product [Soboliphyme baturini]|uniref:Uncharacterized protein n=1 Tax=Soboliphyme baturini TaxID=241478 RepID=A0A183IUU4_9BILA|nr:unnamed protein product [Soboliphyme baturini]